MSCGFGSDRTRSTIGLLVVYNRAARLAESDPPLTERICRVNRWRVGLALLLLLGLGLPLAMPFVELIHRPEAWRAWDESDRLLDLMRNTVLLVGGTLALAMPAGILGAVLLNRTDLPFRQTLRFLTVLTLFVPLPLFASAWQAALGTGGWLPLPAWTTPLPGDPDVAPTGIAWKPWAQGLDAAIWVHAVAGLPWVVWIVGQGLSWVERELEEDALLLMNPLRVLLSVTLPRCRAAIFAAGLWVALQTATEITVTDMMQVRTFAEEVYTQFTRPDPEPAAVQGRDVLARAVAVNLPPVLLTVVLVVWAAGRWEKTLPPLESREEPLCLIPLGRARGWWLAGMLGVVAVLAGVPVVSLVWKAGLGGSPETWSVQTLAFQLLRVPSVHGRMLVESISLGAAAGVVAAALALVGCWLAIESRWFRAGLLGLMALCWAMPGPVIGIGLKETINLLMVGEEAVLGRSERNPFSLVPSLRELLYDGPSLLPVLWAVLLRFFPCAVAILWPVIRLVPAELRDAARVDGAKPRDELRFVIWPLGTAACLRAGLAVGVLSLGELSAGKLVETPGSQTFAHKVFEQMHYGVTSELAALCLVLLATVVGSAMLLRGVAKW